MRERLLFLKKYFLALYENVKLVWGFFLRSAVVLPLLFACIIVLSWGEGKIPRVETIEAGKPNIVATRIYYKYSDEFDDKNFREDPGVLTYTRKARCEIHAMKVNHMSAVFEIVKKKFKNHSRDWWIDFMKEWSELSGDDRDIAELVCSGGTLDDDEYI